MINNNAKFTNNAMTVIGKSYIKYDRLMEMTNTAFVGSDATECNIFIDLYSVLKGLYSSLYNPNKDTNNTDIAAGIINMIAHYRRFYWERYKVKTHFYLIYSLNCSRSSALLCPGYNGIFNNSYRMNKEVTDAIGVNLGILEQMCKYIEEVAYVYTNQEVSSCIYYYINEGICNASYPNIVITKDEVTMQVISIPNTIIFRPKKVSGEDKSYFINANNNGIFYHFCDSNKVKTPDILSRVSISNGLYSLCLTITKVSDRNIKSLLDIPMGIEFICKIVEENDGMNFYYVNPIDFILQSTNDKVKAVVLHGGFGERFKAIDMIYNYGLIINNPSEKIRMIGPQNLYDPNGFKAIINTYFKDVEINLQYL